MRPDFGQTHCIQQPDSRGLASCDYASAISCYYLATQLARVPRHMAVNFCELMARLRYQHKFGFLVAISQSYL
jgi:hypothetical protein